MDEDRRRITRIVIIIAAVFMVIMLLLFAGVAAFIMFVMNMIGDSEPSVTSFEIISQDENVQSLLGEPIERGMFTTGSLSDDKANLNYGIKGPKQSANVYVYAEKMGDWQFKFLSVTADNRTKISIIDNR